MSTLLGDCLTESASGYKNKVAVQWKNNSITYFELDSLTNKIAHIVKTICPADSNRIGIYIDKSIEAVVAIFGILKAGCTYVPLDPKSPLERISYIINNCQLGILLTETNKLNKLASILPTVPHLKHIVNLTDRNGTEKHTDLNNCNYLTGRDIASASNMYVPPNNASENNLAYILYTSGSTGKPKGVMLTHKNALTFINWAIDYFDVTHNDVLSSHAPFHFDLSIFDIYAAIKTGATLCLVPSGISFFPVSLADFIEKNRITIWYSVPSVLVQMIQHGKINKHDFSSLRAIIYAGEVFQFPYLNQLRKLLPSVEIINLYGPTETNVITCYNLKNSPDELTDNVPIGVPCPYAEILVVDENNKPVDAGKEGELIVRGDSLMEGYWGDHEKTKASIREIVINNTPGYFYLTGDIVTQNADGNIIYKNRRDNMIKTRGFRVELGEIETTLFKNDKIQEAAVVAVPDNEIGSRIKAVVVLKEGLQLDAEDIERFCARFLPAYMIPATIEFRDKLPKNPNGKTDKQALI